VNDEKKEDVAAPPPGEGVSEEANGAEKGGGTVPDRPAKAADPGDGAPPAEQPPAAEAKNGAEQPPAAAEEQGEAPVSEQEKLVAERDKLKDQVLRVAADFDNFRKRTRRDLEENRLKGNEDAIREFLPVFDNLARAIGAYETAKNAESIVEGVRMVLKMFDDVSERIGLQRLAAIGQRFDPAVHDAIQQVETDQYPPGTVVTEVNPGYRFRQRLLRPAIVIVARAPKQKAAAEEKPEEEPRKNEQEAPQDQQPAPDAGASEAGSGEQSS
jgi:molecular chaperone GrpE